MANKWVKIWERGEYNLHKMGRVAEILFTGYTRKFLGRVFYGSLSIQMKNGNHAFCMRENEYKDWRKRIDSLLFSQQKFSRYLRVYEQSKKRFIETSHFLGREAKGASRQQLAKLLGNFLVELEFGVIGQWASFYLAERVDEEMRRLAIEMKLDSEATAHFLEIVLMPAKMSAIRQERAQLLKIALIKDAKKRASHLEKHARQFEWIPCINVLEPKPWPKSFFARELKKVFQAGNAKEELSKMKAGYKHTNSAFKKILKQFGGRDKELIKRARIMSFIKDDRDDTRRLAYYYATPLYEAIARSLRISTHDLLLYLSSEISTALTTGELLTKSELAKRRRGYALIVKKGRLVVKTGKDYQKYLKQIETKQAQGHTAKGISASGGVIKGKAKIVQNVYELSKVKKGDILVTGTTHPDYLPAMRLAAAFVTDEGGLTSHAAIVAREMGKPCVVGTKNATKVFKDGDIIEVDANKGAVKKI